MRFRCSLNLPLDARTLPMARHCCSSLLEDLGVSSECTDSISSAFNEACANVIQHSDAEGCFEATFEVDENICAVSVADRGGFDIAQMINSPDVDLLAENGRGIRMMHLLMDRVVFAQGEENETIVRLEKELAYDRV